MSMESPENHPRQDSQPDEPASVDTAAPAPQLLAELETTRARASMAAKLVLELNGRLAAARAQQQQFQQTFADLQTALQTQQAARAQADAAILALTQQLETTHTDRQRLSDQLDAREREWEIQAAQRSAEQEALKRDLAGARAALVDNQQAYLDIEQRLEQQTQTEAALRQAILESQARAEQQDHMLATLRQTALEHAGQTGHQSQIEADLRQRLQTATASQAALAQTEAALRQQLVQAQRQNLAAQDELAARQAAQTEQQAQIEHDLRQHLQAATASQAELTQAEAALRQQLTEAQRQNLAGQDELAALQATHSVSAAELQEHQRRQQDLEQTLATERNLWSTLQDQWAQYKVANQTVQDAVQRQLNDSETALRASQAALTTKLDESASLAEQQRQAQQALAAGADAQHDLRAELDASLAELERVRRQLSEQDSELTALEGRWRQRDNPLADAPMETSPVTNSVPKLAARASMTSINRLSQATDLDRIEPIAPDPCPHLGLKTDRETRHGFVSANNRCYARNIPLEVTVPQQTNFCLHNSYRQCPVFTGALRSPKEPINTDPVPARRDLLPRIWRNKK